MNKIIKKAPVFQDAETIKRAEEQTKRENLEALKIVNAEIKAILNTSKK